VIIAETVVVAVTVRIIAVVDISEVVVVVDVVFDELVETIEVLAELLNDAGLK
jgi:hypothetical protein